MWFTEKDKSLGSWRWKNVGGRAQWNVRWIQRSFCPLSVLPFRRSRQTKSFICTSFLMWISWLFWCCLKKEKVSLHGWSSERSLATKTKRNLEFTHLVYLTTKTWLKITPFAMALINWYIFLSLSLWPTRTATTYSTLLKISWVVNLTPLATFFLALSANWFRCFASLFHLFSGPMCTKCASLMNSNW